MQVTARSSPELPGKAEIGAICMKLLMYRVQDIVKCVELCAGWWMLVLWGSSVRQRPAESVVLVGAPPVVHPER